jgi:hypothetical protein
MHEANGARHSSKIAFSRWRKSLLCVEVSRLKSPIVSIYLLDPLKVTTSLALTRAWPARLPGQTANVFPEFGIIFTEPCVLVVVLCSVKSFGSSVLSRYRRSAGAGGSL